MTQAPNQKAKDTLELRRQQSQRTPEAIAETYRQKQERDAQEIAEQAAADRLSKYARDNGDWEASRVTQNRFEDNRKTAAKYVDADWARQQAEFERDKKTRKIEEIYDNNNQAKGLGITKAQLARELNKDPDTIGYHVRVLQQEGLVGSSKYYNQQEADAIRRRVREVARNGKV